MAGVLRLYIYLDRLRGVPARLLQSIQHGIRGDSGSATERRRNLAKGEQGVDISAPRQSQLHVSIQWPSRMSPSVQKWHLGKEAMRP
jgi:hypothetical protein